MGISIALLGFRVEGGEFREIPLPSRKLTWKPKKGPIQTTVPLKGGYMGFHVSLGECITLNSELSFAPST